MCPHISTVVSDVDRNIAHDADAVTTAQTPYLFPLPEEFELGKPVKLQLGRQVTLPFLQSSGVSLTDSRVPMHPGHVMMDSLARHEERIIPPATVCAPGKTYRRHREPPQFCLQRKHERPCEGAFV